MLRSTARVDPFARYRTVGTAAAVLILALGAKEIWQNFAAPNCRDFLNFWTAARFAIAGASAQAYDPQALHALEASVVRLGPDTQMPFAYLPPFLLIVLPFGFLSYPLAMAMWVAATLIAYAAAVSWLDRSVRLLAFAFPPILVTIALGQNGLLTSALFIAAIASLERRPFVAGLFAGCLILKPQLALFLPLALIAGREWRAIAGAVASSTALILLSVLAFGIQSWIGWFHELPLLEAVTRDGLVGWLQLTSVYAAAREAGLGPGSAMIAHGAVALTAAALVWNSWRSSKDNFARGAVLASATCLASPYLFLYDLPVLVVPLLWLAKTRAQPLLVALCWCISAAAIAEHFVAPGYPNANPLIAITLLAATVWKQRRMTAQAPMLVRDSLRPA